MADIGKADANSLLIDYNHFTRQWFNFSFFIVLFLFFQFLVYTFVISHHSNRFTFYREVKMDIHSKSERYESNHSPFYPCIASCAALPACQY
ncbi:MAG: hypothetical protein K2K95_13550, partial [Muribaculaceae bacterium]|nr:hypothetical protein [Muribaculaceae bacterium]